MGKMKKEKKKQKKEYEDKNEKKDEKKIRKSKIIRIKHEDSHNNENNENKENDSKKNKVLYELFERLSYFKKNLKQNCIFWIFFAISIVILSLLYGKQSTPYRNIKMGIFSIFIAMLSGYNVHMLSHMIDHCKLYDDLINSEYSFTIGGKYLEVFHKLIKFILTYTYDFHDVIHHDSSINRKWYNIFIEGFQNVWLEGVWIIILSNYFNFGINCCGEVYKFNHSIILFWAIVYVTGHLINYRIYDPNAHTMHHKNYFTNLSLTDFYDLVFNTKHDVKDIQDIRHFKYNIVISLLVIIFLKSNSIDSSILKKIKYYL